MSVRNKKLTALHTLNHSLEHSLEKVKNGRANKSEEKKENPFLAKLSHHSVPKKFQVRKIPQPEL